MEGNAGDFELLISEGFGGTVDFELGGLEFRRTRRDLMLPPRLRLSLVLSEKRLAWLNTLFFSAIRFSTMRATCQVDRPFLNSCDGFCQEAIG